MSLEPFLVQFYTEYNSICDELNSLEKVNETSDSAAVGAEKKLKLSTTYEDLSNRTLALQKYLTENTQFIPVYETRKAQEHFTKLTKLSQDKREQIFPKKKFGFKSKQKMTSLADAINTQTNQQNVITTRDSTNNEEIFFKDSSCSIKDIDGQTIVKHEAEVDGQDIGILNIKNSTIQIYGNPSVLHAKNIENSVIICGPISGSAFVGNLKNVKLIIACHQLRIHETHESEFYIHLGSRAIIENCSNVKFAKYSLSYPNLTKHFEKSGLSHDKSNWECIDDFNWLNEKKESPNWSFLDENKRLKWTVNESGELISQ